MVGGADGDSVYVLDGKEFTEVGEGLAVFAAVFFVDDVFGSLLMGDGCVADCDALAVIVPDEVFHVAGALAANAYETHYDSIAGSGRSENRRGNYIRCTYHTSNGGSSAFHETSPIDTDHCLHLS